MSSNLEQLRQRTRLLRPANNDRQLRIEMYPIGTEFAFRIFDAQGQMADVYNIQDVHAIVALEFKTIHGARQALNQVDPEPQQNYVAQSQTHDMNGLYKAEPGIVRPADIPPPPVMSPEAQAAALRLRDRALSRPAADPSKTDKPTGKFGEADSIDNPGDPQVLYGTDPDPELGQS